VCFRLPTATEFLHRHFAPSKRIVRGEGGLNVIDLGAYGRRAFFTVDVGETLLRPLAHVLDLRGIEIA